MQPDLILIPFARDAAAGNVDAIPNSLGPSDPPQAASWTQGFPAVTMTPLAAGGIPPRGQSFNGVLQDITEHLVFIGGGGQYKWSTAYVAAKGGYSIGDVIQSDDGLSSYISAVNSNTTNFNTTPASIGVQWIPYAGASIPNRVGNYSRYFLVSGSGPLSAGACYLVNTASLSLGLPDLVSTSSGDAVTVAARQAVTISVTGSGVINFPSQSSGSSVTLRAGEQAQFVSNGSNSWAISFITKNPQYQEYTAFTTGGTAAALILTPIPAIAAYVSNLRFRARFSQASTPTTTINVSGVGARLLKQYDSAGVKVPAVYVANQLGDIEYDGVDFVLLNQLPAISIDQSMIAYFARNTAPAGWLKANGSVVSRTTYAALFAAIGTVFGAGDGSTTFQLPDMRAEFPRGWDDGRGINSGRIFGSLELDMLKSHDHAISGALGSPAGVTSGNPNVWSGSGPWRTEPVGGTETRPRNVALLACIKI